MVYAAMMRNMQEMNAGCNGARRHETEQRNCNLRRKGSGMSVVDEQRLEEFMGRIVGYMTGGAACLGIWLGDELGLYKRLVEGGEQSADQLAGAAACNPRLVREWLDGQAAAGLIAYDPEADRYSIGPEAAMALADDTSPAFTARGMNTLGAMFKDFEKVRDAFKGDGGLSWGEHHQCLFKGTEWFFRTGYRAHLPGVWIPALEGVEAKLQAGARVADVGCGHGASVVVMADAYPKSRFWGFDFHEPSIRTARERGRRPESRTASHSRWPGPRTIPAPMI